MMDKMKNEIKTVKALKEQVYDVEMQMRRLKEQVGSSMRDKLRWKTRAINLKKQVKISEEAAARTRGKPGEREGGSGGGAGWTPGGVGSRIGEILPVVTRGHTGYVHDVRPSKTSKSVDFGDSLSEDDDWGEEDELVASPGKGQTSGRMAASTSPGMNFSKVYDRGKVDVALPAVQGLMTCEISCKVSSTR